MGFYGMLIGGWATGSKYALLGGLRAVAQLVSYEVAFTLAIIGVVIQSRHALAAGHRQRPERLPVHRPADPRLRDLLHRGAGRVQPAAVRPRRGRRRDRRRLPHRVRRHALRDVRERRVRRGDRARRRSAPTLFLGGWRGPLPFEPFTSIPGPLWMIGSRRSRILFTFIWIRATRAAAALRPPDEARLEGAPAARDAQPPRYRRLGGADLMGSDDALRRSPGTPDPRRLDLGRRRRRASRASRSRCGTSSASRSRSSTPSTSAPSTRASAAATACTGTRTASRSASAARSAPPPARPTASASSPTRTSRDARVSPGERYARIYEINMARCIFCGYCEIACPFDAITLGNDFELSELSRDALIYTKEMLLEPPVRRTPAQDPDEFDRGAQEIEGAGVLGMYHVYSQNHDEVPESLIGTSIFYLAGAAALGSAIARRRAAQPVPGGALADPAPGLAGHALPRAAGRLRRRRADARVRRRRDGHVPVRDRLPRRPRRPRPADAAASARAPRSSPASRSSSRRSIAVSDSSGILGTPAEVADSFGSPADDRPGSS